MKQPISILLAGILAMGLSACGPKADTTAGTNGAAMTDTTATTAAQPAVVNPDSATAGTNLTNATTPGGPGTGSSADPTSTASGANMGTDTSAMGSTGAAGTTASGSDMTATGTSNGAMHSKAPGTNESHPRAEAVNRANGVK